MFREPSVDKYVFVLYATDPVGTKSIAVKKFQTEEEAEKEKDTSIEDMLLLCRQRNIEVPEGTTYTVVRTLDNLFLDKDCTKPVKYLLE